MKIAPDCWHHGQERGALVPPRPRRWPPDLARRICGPMCAASDLHRGENGAGCQYVDLDPSSVVPNYSRKVPTSVVGTHLEKKIVTNHGAVPDNVADP